MKRFAPALLFLAACSGGSDATGEASDDAEEGVDYEDWDGGKSDGTSGLGGPIRFAAACEEGQRVTIGAVGDLLIHGPLQEQATVHPYRFRSLWSPISDLLASTDITYANLEGPVAAGTAVSGRDYPDPGFRYDNVVYTSYPRFNYHPYLAEDLIDTGFDVVSTANNHSLDRQSLGADRTLDTLDTAGMPYTGTRRRGDDDALWYTTTTARDVTLAWIACTFSTNGIPDRHDQVLECWTDETKIKRLIGELRATPGIDAIVITPHWGTEYSARPTRAQRTLAKSFLEAGATLILGAHPHVLQPWEKVTTSDGRETFAIYSLGNFVSGQTDLPRRSTLLLYVGLTKTEEGTKVNGVRYVPLIMNRRDNVRAVESIDRAGGNAASRRLTVDMFGTENLQDPEADVVTSGPCEEL
jgi:poly-gamma-glutamate synthesis protein (capsule biosynthesis protein)